MTDISDIIAQVQGLADGGALADWRIAELSAEFVGKRDGTTKAIAAALHPPRAVDWIERRAAAGKLFAEMEAHDAKTAAELRHKLTFQFFTVVWKARKNDDIDVEQAFEWLDDAAAENLTAEQLRKLLPGAEKEESYKMTCERYFKKLDGDLIHAPFTDCDEAKAVKVSEAAQILLDAVGELLEAE